jgi:hypothetical protein
MSKVKSWVAWLDMSNQERKREGHYSTSTGKPSGLRDLCGLDQIDYYRATQYVEAVAGRRHRRDARVRGLLAGTK